MQLSADLSDDAAARKNNVSEPSQVRNKGKGPHKDAPYIDEFYRTVGDDKHILWAEHKGDGTVKTLLIVNGRLLSEGGAETMGEHDLTAKIVKEGWQKGPFSQGAGA